MRNQLSGRDRGFTLVEMSIVLVIIGLIIGGILKGQEVIASARQKAVINQINAIRAASNTYFDRYRALPGDDPTAQTVVDTNLVNGDGNGVVGASAASTAAILAVDGTANENYTFFNGLVAAGLINGAQVTNGIVTTGFGISALPAAPVTGAGFTIAYGTHAGGGANNTKTSHYIVLHKGTTPANTQPAISPRTAQNIDTQIDDGMPDRGGVRGDDLAAQCNTAGADNRYTISDNTTCYPLYEITQ